MDPKGTQVSQQTNQEQTHNPASLIDFQLSVQTSFSTVVLEALI